MQRRNQFITAALTAALTFGVLTLTLGQRHYDAWHGHHGYTHGHHHDNHHNCDDHSHEKQKGDSSQNEL